MRCSDTTKGEAMGGKVALGGVSWALNLDWVVLAGTKRDEERD